MAELRIDGLSHQFDGHTVLDELSLTVADGEFLVLVGPSGCGKSTLLRIVAGLLSPSAGQLFLGDERIDERSPRERDVAVVFQNYALYPHMSVASNLAFPLEVRRLPKAQVRERVSAVAQTLGLTDLLARKPHQLSGGQMQRVALGRAMIRDPKLFLFDEPLSNLDAQLRQELRAEIARLHERLGITSLYVTHDQAEAMTMGARIAVLESGRLQQIGPPREVYAAPSNTFVARFIGTPPMNLVTGELQGGHFVAGDLALTLPRAQETADPGTADHGTGIHLGVRPEHVRSAAPGRGTAIEVERVELLGREAWAHCRLAGQPFLVCGAEPLEWSAGESRRVEWAAERAHWFNAETGSRLPADE